LIWQVFEGVETMLKKLEYYYNEDGEKIDITDEKIYWDTLKNQFRHKFKCGDCGKDLGCRCYDTLESALKGVEEDLVCEECGIDFALSNLCTSEIIDYSIDKERREKVFALMKELYGTVDLDDLDDDADEKIREYAISLMTEDEKRDEWYETLEGYAEGEACNLRNIL